MFKAAVAFLAVGISFSLASKCEDGLLSAKKKQEKGLMGIYAPTCEEDGTYKAKQCWSSTGMCFCVDKDGTRISNYTRSQLSCECIRSRYTATRKGLIGSYIPQCHINGSYQLMQCWGSTGACWCVDEQGKKVAGGTDSLKSCACLVEKYKAEQNGLSGTFRPKCEADGSYSNMQFHEGYSWCVDANGKIISEKSRLLKSCKCITQNYEAKEANLLGSFRPRCEADGTFSAMQCTGNFCWCARADGTAFKSKKVSLEVCTCYKQEDAILQLGLSVSLPDCA